MLRFIWVQQGDTIIEVLIAVAVISLVLVTAFVVTNRNTTANQDTQERLQAQHIAEGQIEALRSQNGITTSGDCFKAATETGDCADLTQPGSGAAYDVNIQGPAGLNPASGTGRYTISVHWGTLGAGSSSEGNITMAYRLN